MLSRLSHLRNPSPLNTSTHSHSNSSWSAIAATNKLLSNSHSQPPSNSNHHISRRGYYRFQVHTDFVKRWTTNNTLQQWINERIQLFQPTAVHLCDGSDDENTNLINKQIQMGTLIKLNDQLRPNSYVARSSKSDTARVEDATFICSESRTAAGPTKLLLIISSHQLPSYDMYK